VIPAPLAAGFDWIEGLLPLLFLVFWIVSNIINVIRKVAAGAGPKPGEVRPVPPRRAPPAADAPAPPGDAREVLERQIEEFLRGSRPGRAAEPPRPAVAPARPPQRERKAKDRGQRPPAREPARAGKSGKPAEEPRPQPVTERHLSGLSDTGADVARHVNEAFTDHLGHLASSITGAKSDAPSVARPPATAVALDILTLARNPATLRQMIILREVIDRPVDRW
jgi:hypothetical protein